MTETLSVLYIWLKSAHIIFVIFWMAGLFMIPRFFVYHQESAEGSEEAAKWVDRESKLGFTVHPFGSLFRSFSAFLMINEKARDHEQSRHPENDKNNMCGFQPDIQHR